MMTGHDIDASPPVDVLGEFAQAAPICKEHRASLHVVDGEDGWVGGLMLRPSVRNTGPPCM